MFFSMRHMDLIIRRRGRSTSAGELVLQQHQMNGTRAARGSVSFDDADVRAAAVIGRAGVFICGQTHGSTHAPADALPMTLRETLTVLLHVELVDGVDVAQRRDARLDLGASLTRDLIDALDHLLLPVDPVQEIPKHRQTHRLQDVGVLDDDPIGSWRREGSGQGLRGGAFIGRGDFKNN